MGRCRAAQLLRAPAPRRLLGIRRRRTAQRRRRRTGRLQPVAGRTAGARPCRACLPAGNPAVGATGIGAGWHQAHHQLPARAGLAARAAGRPGTRARGSGTGRALSASLAAGIAAAVTLRRSAADGARQPAARAARAQPGRFRCTVGLLDAPGAGTARRRPEHAGRHPLLPVPALGRQP
ncbi:hypothetical protein G6F32_014511 [Rhizopus arrhizus]|nr:hypothetical protein G6F32_014511 [Rhizopus arrhizus]